MDKIITITHHKSNITQLSITKKTSKKKHIAKSVVIIEKLRKQIEYSYNTGDIDSALAYNRRMCLYCNNMGIESSIYWETYTSIYGELYDRSL